jgi:glycerol-1-phosphate dehydrogenase [NAD(P)+]
MQLPREVIVGKGTLSRVHETTKRLGLTSSALILSGPKSWKVAGHAVFKQLEQEGIAVDSIVIRKATMKDVLAAEDEIREFKPQVLIAVGGGTKIDAAKLSSAHQGIPFISVPTALSHDGIASPLASVRDFDKPYSVMAQAPLAIVADTEIIAKAPKQSIISGYGDVLAKFTAVRDWQLAHDEKNEYYGEYAAGLALMSAKLVLENTETIKQRKEEGLRVLFEALVSCGVAMAIAGSSRPCSGSEHMFSHALDSMRNNGTMHGEQCGLGTILMTYLHNANWKRIRDALKRMGAPTTGKELHTKNEDIVKALEMAISVRPERYTILHKLNLSHEACEKVARATGVIEEG